MTASRRLAASHRALIAFAEVMRAGGVGRAAERLGLTHGAVSRQIAALEERLAMSLFEGPRNRRRPTAEAEVLFAEIAGPLEALEAAVNRRSGHAGRMTVSCVSTLAARWLIPRLADFTAGRPGVTVEIRESYAPLDRTLDGCDLAIRMSRSDEAPPKGLTAHPFMANAIGLVVAPGRADQADVTGRRLASRSHPGAWAAWRDAADRPGPTTAHQTFDHQRTMIEATLADDAAFTAYTRTGQATREARWFLAWLEDQGAAEGAG